MKKSLNFNPFFVFFDIVISFYLRGILGLSGSGDVVIDELAPGDEEQGDRVVVVAVVLKSCSLRIRLTMVVMRRGRRKRRRRSQFRRTKSQRNQITLERHDLSVHRHVFL